jgi:hypothetical protein
MQAQSDCEHSCQYKPTEIVKDSNAFDIIDLLGNNRISSNESTDSKHSKQSYKPCLFLNSVPPNRVLSLDTLFQCTFGFKKEELQKSLLMITGPNTDMKGFNDLIRSCLRDLQSERTLIFYKKNGDEIRCNVKGTCTLFEGAMAARLEFEIEEDSPAAQNIPAIIPCRDEDPQSKSLASRQEEFDLAGDLLQRADIDPSVFIHMRAVHRAAQAAKREQGS